MLKDILPYLDNATKAGEGGRTTNIPCDWGGGILKLVLKVPS
jgi:hypothetical protein